MCIYICPSNLYHFNLLIMKSLKTLSAVTMMSLAMVGCSQEDLSKGGDSTKASTEINSFDFSTVVNPNVTVSYKNQGFGNITSSVFFKLYSENPVKTDEEGHTYVDQSVKALFAGYTNELGEWSGKVELPAYTKTLYAYTPSKLGATVLEAQVAGNQILLLDAPSADDFADETRASVKTGLKTSAVTVNGWLTLLGKYSSTGMDKSARDYNKYSGGISYADKFANAEDERVLKVSKQTASQLLSLHQQVIEVTHPCPVKYRTSQDLKVTKDAAVAVTLLGGNTGWSCSMAYYYYKDGETPTDRSQIKPILIVPNTQDGMYNDATKSKDIIKKVNSAKGIDRGTNVQLYYYGEDMKGEPSRVFPKGTRIGFILKGHAWNDGNGWNCHGYTVNGNNVSSQVPEHFSTSTPGLNSGGIYPTGSGVAMYTPDNKHVLFSFEDHDDDENFSDVVFTMTTNPESAFTDVKTVDDVETKVSIQKGVYAFEDLWPSAGDYDMNDVVVEASAEKTILTQNKIKVNTLDNNVVGKTSSAPSIKSETFIFDTEQNYATLANGLAFTFVPAEGVTSDLIEKAELTIDGVKADFTVKDDVYYLTDNISNILGKEIRLTLTYKVQTYDEASERYVGNYVPSTAQSAIKPFIYRDVEGRNWEVHIPYEAPTKNADLSWFGTVDDKSNIDENIYYVRSGLYPFAFYLSGATITDLKAILERPNESKAIDALFPEFGTWSTSNGTKCKDWYK